MSIIDRNYKDAIKSKWVYLDTDAIVGVMQLKSENLLSELASISNGIHIHNFNRIEFMASKDEKEHIRRVNLLKEYEIIDASDQFPVRPKDFEFMEKVREYMARNIKSNQKVAPSMTDLTLGCIILSKENRILLTGNYTDFPEPLFKREAAICIQNNTGVKTLFLVSKGDVDIRQLE